MSTADQDMFDKMLGRKVELKKQEDTTAKDYAHGWDDGYLAGRESVLKELSDDGK